ncbi:hypothetical protein NE848_09045 [Gramella jeungdoensis]|uniref:Thiol:disulfide interchange protein DsbD N-terminal domain-containing protein n=1 Tax=Gramella jeungdoensis TaxID=708091 RepID=A0ABT0Z1C9_9FLAO|nr:hypothetical protein [Gramella jeungdoensis]MCM8569525.1 hypothetical protein [Gramella jeungdoensis]
MNYFSLLLFALVFFISASQDEFVYFEEEETEVKTSQSDYEISLSFKILDGYYIQAESGVPENIIPTQVSFRRNTSYEVTGYEFSSMGEQTIFLDTTAHNVLSDRFEIMVYIKIKEGKLKQVNKLAGELYYQACNTRQCFYPRTLNFEVEFI